MEVVMLYILEKFDDRDSTAWEEVGFYMKSDLGPAIDDFDLLAKHGGLDYRLREISIEGGGAWDWKVVKSTMKAEEALNG